MTQFLWAMALLGVCEMALAIYYSLKGEVPERTASGLACNAAIMFGLGMWAFWLLVSA